MDDIKIDGNLLQKVIEESLPKILAEKLTASYGNPIQTVIDEEIKNNEGTIRDFVKDTIVSTFSDAQFRDKISSQIIAMIIQKGLGK